jgi:hypothetical protein
MNEGTTLKSLLVLIIKGRYNFVSIHKGESSKFFAFYVSKKKEKINPTKIPFSLSVIMVHLNLQLLEVHRNLHTTIND